MEKKEDITLRNTIIVDFLKKILSEYKEMYDKVLKNL